MEKLSKSELLRLIDEQRDKLSRYESRLRDVVTAYKGLLKEKEALEASLKALASPQPNQLNTDKSTVPENYVENKPDTSCDSSEQSDIKDLKDDATEGEKHKAGDGPSRETEESGTESGADIPAERVPKEPDNEALDQLRVQIATLMYSLSTLSAEKSRMEAGFQADKRQLRQEKEEREKTIHNLQEQIHQLEKQHRCEVESLKSKLIVERHEREREHNDHGIMIKELQKLTADERREKEHLEAMVADFKVRSAHTDQLEKRLRDAQNELESIKSKLRRSEATAQEASPILLQLQAEMSHLKQQHTVAIQEEQRRAVDAEDQARHLAAVHEERVANLESRLAELSESVGNYDRLRQKDQLAIQRLKERIAQLDQRHVPTSMEDQEKDETAVEVDPTTNVQTMLQKLLQLKDQIMDANRLSEKPVDVEGAILAHFEDFGLYNPGLHSSCEEEIKKLKQDLEQTKHLQAHLPPHYSRSREGTEVETLKLQIRSLQERVRMLNTQLEQTERAEHDWRAQVQRCQQQLETEKSSWREKVIALESELRARAVQTEQQLSLQRERSLALIEDKEQEIRTLKSSFQMFLPPGNNSIGSTHPSWKVSHTSDPELTEEEPNVPIPDSNSAGGLPGILLRTLNSVNGVSAAVGTAENPHILHYAHELARREVDISTLRKARNKLESSLREMTKLLTAERERHREEIRNLQKAVSRLERCKSREGANLEYLKNVVLSFLESSSPNSKRHMLNAIAAVLKFSDDELDRVSRHSSNSWWYNSQ